MTEETIKDIFLNDLTEATQHNFAAECFADEELFAQAQEVEEGLILDYLRDELAPTQKDLFERNYLVTNGRRERVAFLAALVKHASEYSPAPIGIIEPNSSWRERLAAFCGGWRWPLAAGFAVALLLIGGAAFLRQSPAPEITANSNTAPTVYLQTLPLIPLLRGADAPPTETNVHLPLLKDLLRLELPLPAGTGPARLYLVEVQQPDGNVFKHLLRGQKSVQIDFLARDLMPGHYMLNLYEADPDGTKERAVARYTFLVTRIK